MKGGLVDDDRLETIRTPTGSRVHLGYLAGVRIDDVAYYATGCGLTVDYPDVTPTDEVASCQPCRRAAGI